MRHDADAQAQHREIGAVVAGQRKALPAAALETWELRVAEVPAPGPLAEVTAHRAHRADLRGGHRARGLRQRGEAPSNPRVPLEIDQGHRRANAQAAIWQLGDPSELRDALDVDEHLGHRHAGPGDPVLHETQQVGAAGQNLRQCPVLGERAHRVGDGRRVHVGERGQLIEHRRSCLRPAPRGCGRR